jgi:hypothetical protein
MKKQIINDQFRRMQKLAGLLKEERIIHFVKPFAGGGSGHGEEYEEARIYEKGTNVVFKMGDPKFDGVPSTVFVMHNKNIYNAMDILAKEGYPVLDNKIEVDPENEYAVEDLLLDLKEKGIVTEFNPEIDIRTKEDVDKYNSYLPEDEQLRYEDFGPRVK